MTDYTQSEQYTISIRLSTDGFSFSVFNPLGEGEHVFTDCAVNESLSLTANLKQLFREEEGLQHPYRRVNILMADKRYTLMPLEFFEDEQAELVFYHNHPPRENECVLYNILAANNMVVLFGMDKSAYNFLTEQFPEAKFYAQASPFIEFFSNKSRFGNNCKLYVHLRKEEIDLYGFDRGHLLLGNSYSCNATADRIYYILYAWKKLGFDQERDELHLTGDLGDKETLLPELRKFIRQVFVMNPVENLDLKAIVSCE